MHKVFMYKMMTLMIQVNVTSNAERLDQALCTMMKLNLIILMQVSSLLTSQLLLNRWNLMVKRYYYYYYFML